jgi:hypothetical protein
VLGGHGYTATGNNNTLYGTQITAIGNNLYVEGSDSVIRGNNLRVKGPRQDVAGMNIELLGGATPHALPAPPPDGKARSSRTFIGSTIGLMGEHARNDGIIVVGGHGGVATRTRQRAREEPYPRREDGPLVLGDGKYVFEKGIKIRQGAIDDGVTYVSTSGPRSPAYVGGKPVQQVLKRSPPDSPPRDSDVMEKVLDEGTVAPVTHYPALPDGGEPSEVEDGTPVCSTCLERRVTTVATPCGHSYSCITCLHATHPTVCDHCRKPVTAFFRLFDASAAL